MSEEVTISIIGAIASIVVAYITAQGVARKGVEKVEAKLESWKLLYEHDSDGNRIEGNIADLIKAINAAYQIKVRIQQKQWSEVMDAQWLFVEDNLVHASNTTQISLGPGPNGNYQFFDDPYHYFVLVNTKGNHHAKRVHIDGRLRQSTENTPNPSNTKRRMAWYAMMPE